MEGPGRPRKSGGVLSLLKVVSIEKTLLDHAVLDILSYFETNWKYKRFSLFMNEALNYPLKKGGPDSQ